MARRHCNNTCYWQVETVSFQHWKTGIATMLFEGGQTVRSRFIILLELNETSLLLINRNSQNACVLHSEKCTLWYGTPAALCLALNVIG
jgi:hypothetical protein